MKAVASNVELSRTIFGGRARRVGNGDYIYGRKKRRETIAGLLFPSD